MKPISGFSKLSKEGKIEWLVNEYLEGNPKDRDILHTYWHHDAELQRLHDEFSENTISNFYMPFGIAPNFLINDKLYAIPMAIEESSVVAAAAKAAKFWLNKGGFKTTILGTEKLGHVHFIFDGDSEKLQTFFDQHLKAKLLETTDDITKSMRARGGGITDIKLNNKTAALRNYWQLQGHFETKDAMGANFINSCLERFAATLKDELTNSESFTNEEKESLQVVMSILSNYTPGCMVRAEVKCPINQLTDDAEVTPEEFAKKFYQAVRIAEEEPYRATTHNKGIMNGVDAVVIATGNDFRAVEACVHTHAAHTGKYQSLTHCTIDNGEFHFWVDMPMALGTVGGLTTLHPLVKVALKILGNPNSEELMGLVAVAGLAQNFGALRSLVTTGIQKGHMKMHLLNILNQLEATDKEKEHFVEYFKTRTVSYSAVVEEFCRLRGVASLDEVRKG